MGPLSSALVAVAFEVQRCGVPLQPLTAALRRLARLQPRCLAPHIASIGAAATMSTSVSSNVAPRTIQALRSNTLYKCPAIARCRQPAVCMLL